MFQYKSQKKSLTQPVIKDLCWQVSTFQVERPCLVWLLLIVSFLKDKVEHSPIIVEHLHSTYVRIWYPQYPRSRVRVFLGRWRGYCGHRWGAGPALLWRRTAMSWFSVYNLTSPGTQLGEYLNTALCEISSDEKEEIILSGPGFIDFDI